MSSAFEGLTAQVQLHNNLVKSQSQVEDYQHEEVVVIVVTHTVVEPNAVVVEVLGAAIAAVAVLGQLEHVALAFVTIKFVIFFWKWQTIHIDIRPVM